MIGLVGGLGPAATVHYYRGLVAESARRSLDLRLVITHADVERVLELAGRGDRQGLAGYLAKRCAELEAAGAGVLALGAVTPHLCLPELRDRVVAPVVDLIDAAQGEVRRRGFGRVVLLGTRTVVESRLFGRLDEAVTPSDPAAVQQVHELYLEIVRRGAVDAAIATRLRKLAADLVATEQADALVLAGTELSLVPAVAWTGMPFVDCADVHIRAMVEAMATTRDHKRKESR